MSRERPINADEPVPSRPEESPPAKPEPPPKQLEKPAPAVAKKVAPKSKPAPAPKPPPAPKPRRQPKPLAPKLLTALVAIAVLFIVVAIVGGTGGGKDETNADAPASAPSVAPDPSDANSDSGTAELGFPVFATGNTTRVGGADPAANAAAVALAVFPSTTAAQRPDAVTLVDGANWASAIAAAVLMAPPVRAPVLFTDGGSPPQSTEEALAALAPGETNRVQASGAAGAAEIAALRDRLFPQPPQHIVLAPEDDPELAAPAAAWAARSGDPVLFAGGDDLPQSTVAYLEKHAKTPIYALGPSSAISSELIREAERVGGPVKRVGGEDAVANAIALARYSDGSFGWDINDPGHGFVLARADSPLDAAAAAPLSASGTWGPLLLTDSADTLPVELREYFLDVKPGYTDNPTRAFYNHVWVIGDQEAIDLNQQAEVNELAELAKIGGAQ
ncbi:MAG TPA: cell wall-binding repeat-containing protein [Solirubrobacterales bacterium]|nr:cell wall-binding repeat-containing protein [Solirubrobacterales bacterium]